MIDLTKFEGHTAGPWSVGPWFDNDGQPEIVIERMTDGGNMVPAVALGGLIGQEANARLIAAAPDLLAEVIRLRAALYSIDRQLGHDDVDDALRDEITAALSNKCSRQRCDGDWWEKVLDGGRDLDMSEACRCTRDIKITVVVETPNA